MSVAKCLGYWWKGDLFATAAVDEGIKKARKAYFQFGSIGGVEPSLKQVSNRYMCNASSDVWL